jgi:uncharacterized membrane protein
MPTEHHGLEEQTFYEVNYTTPNNELMRQATVLLTHNWLQGITFAIIASSIGILCKFIPYVEGIVLDIGSLIVSGFFSYGWANWGLKLARSEVASFKDFFDGFRRPSISLITGLLQILCVAFPIITLAALVGIVQSFEQPDLLIFLGEIEEYIILMVLFLLSITVYLFILFSQIWFFAIDYQSSGIHLFKSSRDLMNGYKYKLFRLLLRYFFLLLLGMIPTILLSMIFGNSNGALLASLIPIAIVSVLILPHLHISLGLFYQDIVAEEVIVKQAHHDAEDLLDQDL